MADPQIELQRVRDQLTAIMERKGLKRKPLAKLAGLGETSIRDLLENPERDIKLGTLFKLTGAMDISIDELLTARGLLPVAGRVGAGGCIVWEEVASDPVPFPPGRVGKVEALEVQGDSMLPKYASGDVIYVEKENRGIEEASFGEFCVVRLTSGETYVKQLARGTRPGFVTLRSLNAADIEDVEIEWAAPVIFVLPKAARRRLGL